MQRTAEIRPLTGLRAVAAFWVVSFHYLTELFMTFPAFHLPLAIISGTGYLGVDLFFILSGFVISYNYAHRFRRYSLSNYVEFIWARFARIYPVHIFALLVLLIFGMSGAFGTIRLGDQSRYSAAAFLDSLFLTHGWTMPVEKSWNVPSWSLSAEWLVYLFFPAYLTVSLWVASHRRHILWVLAVSVLAVSAAAAVYVTTDYGGFAAYGLIRVLVGFLLGCMLYQFHDRRVWADVDWDLIAPLSFALVMFVGALSTIVGLKPIIWAPVLLAVSIYGLLWSRGTFARILASRPFCYWGRVSYSLYMVHFVCILVYHDRVPFERFAQFAFGQKLAMLLLAILVTCLASALTFHCIEEPCRTWMKMNSPARLLRKPAAVQGIGKAER